MISDNKTLDKVYTATNHEELMEAYKDWACNYEADTVGEFGYVAHEVSAKALHGFLGDTSAYILDAGCGTGLVGQVLGELGYSSMDALDYSREMLDEAAKKDVYQKLEQADLSKPLDIDDNTYDAVICVGTFTYGHVDPDGFNELARIVKPGGYMTFTVREGAYEDHDYRKRLLAMEEQGVWELQEMRDADYLRNECVQCKLCTYRIL